MRLPSCWTGAFSARLRRVVLRMERKKRRSMEQVRTENKMGTMPIGKLLANMAIPMMVSMLVQAFYNVVDSVYVSQLNENALSAISLAFPLQNLMIAFGSGTAVGTNALLSRALGAKRHDLVDRAANTSIFLMFCNFAVFCVLGLTLSRSFFLAQTDVSQIVEYGTSYTSICLGASIGIGRKFAPDQIALSFMPYAQLSWDGIHRDDVRESDSRVAQEYEDELLSVAALEAGLAFKTRSSAASPTGNLFLEGRIAYRNRFHVNGDETYTWTGIRDETNVEFFDNRHAAAAQCKIGWVSSTGHEFALMLDGEAGDSGDERWGASLRWTKHF